MKTFFQFIQRALLPCAVLALALSGCGGGNATVGGTVSGLTSGASVTLLNNGSNSLTVTGNGSFTFSGTLADNASYSVTVGSATGTTCTVANGSGTINSKGDSVTNVTVTCTQSNALQVAVTGLRAGASVIVSNGASSGATTLAFPTNETLSFPVLNTGVSYNVTVTTQPLVGSCQVTVNGSGTITSSTPPLVAVTCN